MREATPVEREAMHCHNWLMPNATEVPIRGDLTEMIKSENGHRCEMSKDQFLNPFRCGYRVNQVAHWIEIYHRSGNCELERSD